MNTKTQDKTAAEIPQTAPTGNNVELYQSRIPYRPRVGTEYDISPSQWNTLIDAIWPSAKTADGIELALSYCKKRNLDPFKRPVHIVPMYVTTVNPQTKQKSGKVIETIWPGISEIRTTAFRTNSYAGCDAAEFGPEIEKTWEILGSDGGDDDHPNAPPRDDKKEAKPKVVASHTVKFPEWCQITVYRMIQGTRVAFPGPRVLWLETYATISRNNDAPNEMWRDRPSGQIEKCAEAAALRKAFPEELGSEYVLEEAERVTGGHRMVDITPASEDVPDKRPERGDDAKPKPTKIQSAAESPAAKAARERAAAAATVVEPEVKTTNDQPPPASEETPQMSEALERALSVLQKLSYDEIPGAREQCRKDLSADDYAVWQSASLQLERSLARKR